MRLNNRGGERANGRGRRWALTALCGGLGLTLGGCLTATDLPPESVIEDEAPLEDLKPVGTCESLQGVLAVRALSQMEPILKRNESLATVACGAAPVPVSGVPGEDGASGGAPGQFSDAPEARGYSQSNNQVEGVAEADRVQTDGEHLFVLTDAGLEILRVWPPEDAAHLATVPVTDGRARGLFVADGRAVVYIDDDAPVLDPETEAELYGPYGAPPATGGMCPFGVRCDFSGNGQKLRMLTLDLSVPASPRMLRETRFNGSFLAARRIGDAVHTAIDFPPPAVPGLSFWPEDLPACGVDRDEARSAFDALRRANVAALVDRPLDTWLPRVVDERLPGTTDALRVEGLIEGCDSVWYAHLQAGRSFLSVVSQTMAGDQRLATQTIVAEPGAIYVAPDTLYVASRQRAVTGETWYAEVPAHDEATVVHRFALETQASAVDNRVRPVTRYQGSAVVPGLLLDRYALDERGGQLRVISTLGLGRKEEGPSAPIDRDPILDYAGAYGDAVSDAVRPDEPNPVPPDHAHSERLTRLAVLGRNSAGRLRLNSEVEAAMASTDLSAVRFQGDWAFLAFGASEPLQLVDLTDPEAPKMGGKLRLAGEARFLHPLGGNRLVSVSVVGSERAPQQGAGGDADGTGDDDSVLATEGAVVSLALELFDLSDPNAVRSLGAAHFPGARTAAVTDALAVSWFDAQSVLGVPLQQCSAEAEAENVPHFDGLAVFGIDASEGLVERGRIDHSPDPGAAPCASVPEVRRSVFIEDTVVSVGRHSVALTRLAGFEARGTIPLEGDAIWPPEALAVAGDSPNPGDPAEPDPAEAEPAPEPTPAPDPEP